MSGRPAPDPASPPGSPKPSHTLRARNSVRASSLLDLSCLSLVTRQPSPCFGSSFLLLLHPVSLEPETFTCELHGELTDLTEVQGRSRWLTHRLSGVVFHVLPGPTQQQRLRKLLGRKVMCFKGVLISQPPQHFPGPSPLQSRGRAVSRAAR